MARRWEALLQPARELGSLPSAPIPWGAIASPPSAYIPDIARPPIARYTAIATPQHGAPCRDPAYRQHPEAHPAERQAPIASPPMAKTPTAAFPTAIAPLATRGQPVSGSIPCATWIKGQPKICALERYS